MKSFAAKQNISYDFWPSQESEIKFNININSFIIIIILKCFTSLKEEAKRRFERERDARNWYIFVYIFSIYVCMHLERLTEGEK